MVLQTSGVVEEMERVDRLQRDLERKMTRTLGMDGIRGKEKVAPSIK